MAAADWFLAWRRQAQLTDRILIDAMDPDGVSFTLAGWASRLQGSVRDYNMCLWALRDGACWDLLWDMDIQLCQLPQGWMCGLCKEAADRGLFPQPRAYESPEELWQSHSFDPFRIWLNQLYGSSGVGFYDYDGATVARLLTGGENTSEFLVEVLTCNAGAGSRL